MIQRVETTRIMAALWSCRTCGVGWLSEPAPAAQTWYLYALANLADEPVVNDSGPAWVVSGPDPSICPTCGLDMVQESRSVQAQLN
jgi:hypothetical protein